METDYEYVQLVLSALGVAIAVAAWFFPNPAKLLRAWRNQFGDWFADMQDRLVILRKRLGERLVEAWIRSNAWSARLIDWCYGR